MNPIRVAKFSESCRNKLTEIIDLLRQKKPRYNKTTGFELFLSNGKSVLNKTLGHCFTLILNDHYVHSVLIAGHVKLVTA